MWINNGQSLCCSHWPGRRSCLFVVSIQVSCFMFSVRMKRGQNKKWQYRSTDCVTVFLSWWESMKNTENQPHPSTLSDLNAFNCKLHHCQKEYSTASWPLGSFLFLKGAISYPKLTLTLDSTLRHGQLFIQYIWKLLSRFHLADAVNVHTVISGTHKQLCANCAHTHMHASKHTHLVAVQQGNKHTILTNGPWNCTASLSPPVFIQTPLSEYECVRLWVCTCLQQQDLWFPTVQSIIYSPLVSLALHTSLARLDCSHINLLDILTAKGTVYELKSAEAITGEALPVIAHEQLKRKCTQLQSNILGPVFVAQQRAERAERAAALWLLGMFLILTCLYFGGNLVWDFALR